MPPVTTRWDLRPLLACGSGAGRDYRPPIDPVVSQEALRQFVDAAPDAIVVADGAGSLVLVNRQAERLFGYDRADLLGRPVENLLPRRFRDVHREHRAGYAVDPHTRAMGSGLLLHARRADDTEFPVEVSLSPLRSGDEVLTMAAVRDVTERLEAERQLREAARELTLVEDRERIARDLHDTVVQRLFATGMALQAVASMIDRDSEAARRIDGVVDDLDEAIRDLRTAIYGLQSTVDHGPGFRELILRVLGEERVALPSEPRLRFSGLLDTTPDDVVAAALPALRELLSNVGRHAGATSVEVHVEAGDDLVIRVIDDGRGLDVTQARPGHGLRNLTERAATLGGTFTVEARPGAGTIAVWQVPMR